MQPHFPQNHRTPPQISLFREFSSPFVRFIRRARFSSAHPPQRKGASLNAAHLESLADLSADFRPCRHRLPRRGQRSAVSGVFLHHFQPAPNARESDRGISVQKKTKILILEWDDAWCKVQVGNKVGYAKPEWLYRVQSLDALHYPLQNLPHRMSGYVEFSQDTLISGGKFKGCTASAGQIACVEAQADGAYLLPVWRGEMQLTDEIGTYHPFADWETAEPGDIIGGFTTFYGDQQGQGKAAAREHNISEGVKRIDGVAVEREETFSFNALCAPYRHSNGYKLAPNVSTDGFGYGGGVCQVSTTLYNAALTLPLQIEEWALHSKQGAVYVPQFFDAAVGSYSDFTFVNLLPYGVQIHASAQNGVLTVLFCRAEEDLQ